jgi:stearoyl-CoA desaturase (delta-9 desaturase)
LEDTPSRWVANHRLHHVHSDDDEDPHSPRNGVAWSHVGWLFRRAPERKTLAFFDRYARDILTDKYYRYLERHPMAILWIYATQAVIFWTVGLLVGRWIGGDWQAGQTCAARTLVWGVFVRTVLVWHITWSVNSLTHMFGYRNHETGENSRNNWLVALFACGEGWHNNHHSDPARCSVSQRWWELDVSHLEVRALSFVGITWDIVPGREVRRARAIAAHASAGSSKT